MLFFSNLLHRVKTFVLTKVYDIPQTASDLDVRKGWPSTARIAGWAIAPATPHTTAHPKF